MPTVGEIAHFNGRTYRVVSIRPINPKLTTHPPGSIEVEYEEEGTKRKLTRIEQGKMP